MKKKIIAVSGKQYSGKDTVAKLVLEKFPNFRRVGIGDAIKLEYGKKHGLSFEEIERDKHLHRADLIALGNWGREQDPHFWLKKIVELEYNIIVPDMRVMEELNIFKRENAFLLRVEASTESRSARGQIACEGDRTECELDDHSSWDYVLDNSSDYEALKHKVLGLFDAIEKYFLRP
ncbi:phosphomevalonate kinase [Candidatus Gastranaerophilus sp. (ex Termes propinquus)]|nr:phosphomevalonate kinase [Candidatus Gastranaerophilus sp. (ex Termes propinquus)]